MRHHDRLSSLPITRTSHARLSADLSAWPAESVWVVAVAPGLSERRKRWERL